MVVEQGSINEYCHCLHYCSTRLYKRVASFCAWLLNKVIQKGSAFECMSVEQGYTKGIDIVFMIVEQGLYKRVM